MVVKGANWGQRRLKKKVARDYSPAQIGLVVPSTEYDKPIPKSKFLKRIKEARKEIDNLFGGHTGWNTFGGWYDKNNKQYIREKSVLLITYTTAPKYQENKKKFIRYVKSLLKKWKQYSIGVMIENDMYFVE